VVPLPGKGIRTARGNTLRRFNLRLSAFANWPMQVSENVRMNVPPDGPTGSGRNPSGNPESRMAVGTNSRECTRIPTNDSLLNMTRMLKRLWLAWLCGWGRSDKG
jgi:hypothetical protein